MHALFSIYTAIIGYVYIPPLADNNRFCAGMALGRLYGIYTDPTYASIISFISILIIVYLLIKKRSKLSFLLSVAALISHLTCISLSGSRTTLLSLVAAILFLSFIVSIKIFKKKIIKLLSRIILSLLCSCLCCAGMFGIIQGISFTYEQTEPTVLKLLGGPMCDSIQLFPRQFANKVYKECNLEQITDDDAHYTILNNKETKQSINTEHVGILGRDEGDDISNSRFDL